MGEVTGGRGGNSEQWSAGERGLRVRVGVGWGAGLLCAYFPCLSLTTDPEAVSSPASSTYRETNILRFIFLSFRASSSVFVSVLFFREGSGVREGGGALASRLTGQRLTSLPALAGRRVGTFHSSKSVLRGTGQRAESDGSCGEKRPKSKAFLSCGGHLTDTAPPPDGLSHTPPAPPCPALPRNPQQQTTNRTQYIRVTA